MRRAALSIWSIAVAVAMIAQAQAGTVRFPSDGADLQMLLDGLAPGDTVLIEPGQWTVWGIYLRNGITLRAENGDPSSTCLVGVSTRNTLYAINVSGVILENFTLKRGRWAISCGASQILLREMVVRESAEGLGCWQSSHVVLENVIFHANTAQAVECDQSDLRVDGAEFSGSNRAVICDQSEVAIDGAVFRDNGRAQSGAGLWCYSSDVVLTDCVFESNEVGYAGSTQTTWWYAGSGGGAYLTNGSTLTARDVIFDSNHTWYAGAGLGLQGEGTRAELNDCRFVNNTTSTHVGSDGARQGGAALSVISGAEVTLCDVWFDNNWSNRYGGALYVKGSLSGARAELSRCVFTDNEAEFRGHALCVDNGSINLTNCTVSEMSHGSAVYLGWGATGTVSNCIFSLGHVECYCPSPEVDIRKCCASHGLCGQSENIFADPLFCSSRARDFSLCGDSPCLPMNNEWGELIGAVRVGCGPCGTPVLDRSWGSIKAMFRGD